MAETFTCANCGRTFESDRPEEEVYAEAKENFGIVPSPSERESLCEDCYQRFIVWYRQLVSAN